MCLEAVRPEGAWNAKTINSMILTGIIAARHEKARNQAEKAIKAANMAGIIAFLLEKAGNSGEKGNKNLGF